MTLPEFKEYVQSEFPIPFDEMLSSDDVDGVILNALRKTFTKCEKVESMQVTSGVVIERAISITKCVPAGASASSSTDFYSIWNTMAVSTTTKPPSVSYYFTPEKQLLLNNYYAEVYIEYVVDPEVLQIEDLSLLYLDWAKRYALALLAIKEGYTGTRATLTALPFEFNYGQLKDEGITAKENLEQELEDMAYGCFSTK